MTRAGGKDEVSVIRNCARVGKRRISLKFGESFETLTPTLSRPRERER